MGTTLDLPGGCGGLQGYAGEKEISLEWGERDFSIPLGTSLPPVSPTDLWAGTEQHSAALEVLEHRPEDMGVARLGCDAQDEEVRAPRSQLRSAQKQGERGGWCAGVGSRHHRTMNPWASWGTPHPFREENIWTKGLGAAGDGLAEDLRGGWAARGKELLKAHQGQEGR